jgi:NAD(P)-dependent dehydrogenase (short-subunit alcohol dehydrogenase family)
MSDFRGKVIMITGAAGNLGSATARAFQTGDASLVLVDRHLEDLEAEFPDLDGDETHMFIGADLLDPGAVEGMVYEVVRHFDRLDVLINIVGGFRMGTPVHETPLETWDFMMDLNAKTVLIMARAAVPHMLQQGSGKIVNIGARAALKGSARMAAYVASKSAVLRLTESMAAELKAKGINVNCIMPGTIDTPENREAMPKANHDKWVAPEAIADVIRFLASDGARAVHGACIPVYGLS